MASRQEKKKSSKKPSEPRVTDPNVWNNQDWRIVAGKLVRGRGRPSKTGNLFLYVAEKLPFDALPTVRNHIIREHGSVPEGVYMAHDSMGVARYGGRGKIFGRLASHRKQYRRELVYFSFYVIKEKKHERELETAILRAAGPQMILNQRKVRDGIDPGSVGDFESGTKYYERKPNGRGKPELLGER